MNVLNITQTVCTKHIS